MKIEINIDEEDVRYEVKRRLYKEISFTRVSDEIDRYVEDVVQKELGRKLAHLMKGDQIKELVIQGVIKYLERFQLRELVGWLKKREEKKEK